MKYYLPNRGETRNDAQTVPKCVADDCWPKVSAEIAADWVHSCRGGWESEWPMEIVVIDGQSAEHRFSVDREMMPEFSASPIKEKATK